MIFLEPLINLFAGFLIYCLLFRLFKMFRNNLQNRFNIIYYFSHL